MSPSFACRRGVSEAVAAVLLLVVIATASFFALSNSTKNIEDNSVSVSDALERKGEQALELVSVISRDVSPNKTTLELLNYGTRNIRIADVLVDGKAAQFLVIGYDGSEVASKTLEPSRMTLLQVSGSGQEVQLLTSSGNLIRISLR
ncbi:MAG: hypothetical protein QXG67_00875 [Candidatus Nitrosotenuis sp.]